MCTRLLDENVFVPLSEFLKKVFLLRTTLTHKMAVHLPGAVAGLAAKAPLEVRVNHEAVVCGADQALHLLWELCETCEQTLALVAVSGLLPVVFECLRPEYPANVTGAAGVALVMSVCL